MSSRGRITAKGLLVVLALAGCDQQCENGYKIKKEYSVIFWHESWHENDKDTLLDGAIRTSTWTYRDGRALRVRCFEAAAPSRYKQYDIRYSIEVPLLVRLVPEIEKSGPIEFIVSIDGATVGSIPARIIAQKQSIDFLATLEPALVDRLEGAKKTIVVMPRQKNERLDDVTEFKVNKLAEHIKPVKEACKALHNGETVPAEEPPAEIRRT